MASFQTLTFPGKEIPDVEGTITKILKLSTALNEKKIFMPLGVVGPCCDLHNLL